MVFFKLPHALGYNPVFPLLVPFSSSRWLFVSSRKDRMLSAAIVLISIPVAGYLLSALAHIVDLTAPESAVISALVFCLYMSRLVLLARKSVRAEQSEIVPAGVRYRIYLFEWISFCLSMVLSLFLVAEASAKPVFTVFAAMFLFLLGVPLAQMSMYRLQESTIWRRRRVL